MMISAELKDSDGKVCSKAVISYFTYPEKVARAKLYYPGRDAFFENE